VTSRSGHQGIYAAHVNVETAHALALCSLLKRVLNSSAIAAYTNLPLLLVPLLTTRTLHHEAEDIHCAQANKLPSMPPLVNITLLRFELWIECWHR